MPATAALSESAVALLRFRIRGHRMPVDERRLAAYRELAAAGIMEPVSDEEADFRFTEEGWARREGLLAEAEERIERERYEPPDASHLSEAAREQLRRHLSGDREVTERNRPAYRELVAARIMTPISGFATGPESSYRFTYWGWKRRSEFLTGDGAPR
jgi:hypothetical protein